VRITTSKKCQKTEFYEGKKITRENTLKRRKYSKIVKGETFGDVKIPRPKSWASLQKGCNERTDNSTASEVAFDRSKKEVYSNIV